MFHSYFNEYVFDDINIYLLTSSCTLHRRKFRTNVSVHICISVSVLACKSFSITLKIIGYAVVMLSINVKMAGISFLLLPLVAILTFIFRHLSRKAYQITRNKITELNTFLSEHISGMKLIQIFAREKEKYSEFEGKSIELYRVNFREIMTFAIFRPSIRICPF